MDQHTAAEAAQDMGEVHTALHHSLRLVQGNDQVQAALRAQDGEPSYSALHTTLEHGIQAAERVQQVLRAAARGQS